MYETSSIRRTFLFRSASAVSRHWGRVALQDPPRREVSNKQQQEERVAAEPKRSSNWWRPDKYLLQCYCYLPLPPSCANRPCHEPSKSIRIFAHNTRHVVGSRGHGDAHQHPPGVVPGWVYYLRVELYEPHVLHAAKRAPVRSLCANPARPPVAFAASLRVSRESAWHWEGRKHYVRYTRMYRHWREGRPEDFTDGNLGSQVYRGSSETGSGKAPAYHTRAHAHGRSR